MVANTPERQGNNKRDDRPLTPVPTEFGPLKDRGISTETAAAYRVGPAGKAIHQYPYYNQNGDHIGNKFRYEDKTFSVEHRGNWADAALFGQQVFPPGGKYITVTEGECDAMAAYQLFGNKYPTVSAGSAGDAERNVRNNFKYLDSFGHVIINFDNDEPGQRAAKRVAAMFAPGKARILCLRRGKDANDYLTDGGAEHYIREWWDAPGWTPQGLKLGSSMWDEVSAPKDYETVPYPWDGLNEKTYGLRLSEFVVLNAQTGVGKTTLLKEIEYYILNHSDRGIGLIHLEEPNSDTALGLMSMAANVPLHLPDVRSKVTLEDLKKYYDATVNTDRVVIWDHFGSNSVNEVCNNIRHMHNLGCKYIVLDHLSIVVSDQSGDERKELDEIATKIKMMCMELNICVIAVIHQNRKGSIRGTAGVEQLANIVLKLDRDLEEENEFKRNVTDVIVQKNRFTGRTGPACYLYYDQKTGRIRELTKDEVDQYAAGGTKVEQW